MNRSAILLSGGMDSFALTYEQRPAVAVSLDYGQVPAPAEINAASILTRDLGINHEVITIDLSQLGSGDLCGKPPIELAPVTEWWPFRNQMLITLAAMKLVGMGIQEIIVATVSSDEAHADGSSEFIKSIDQLMTMQEGNVRVSAPAISCTTTELIRRSRIPLPLLAWSHSCHTANIACGRCRGCYKSQTVWGTLETNTVR